MSVKPSKIASPRVTEVTAEVSVGGKLQLVKFEQQADYGFSMGRTYAVDMTEAEAKAFQLNLLTALREEVEPIADREYQALHAARTALAKERHS